MNRDLFGNSETRIACLTLRAHWAAAIFDLGKDVENRTWKTSYRGTLAIHAGRARSIDPKVCADLGLDPERIESGAILGTVQLVDIVRDSSSKWACAGDYHWIIRDPHRLAEPLRCAGKLGMYRVTL